jgi:hypothetical protein
LYSPAPSRFTVPAFQLGASELEKDGVIIEKIKNWVGWLFWRFY